MGNVVANTHSIDYGNVRTMLLFHSQIKWKYLIMKNQIFIDNLQMETQTVFCQNGGINIFPCAFELGQHIVAGGNEASQKGGMVTGHEPFPPVCEGQRKPIHTPLHHGTRRGEGDTGQCDLPAALP